METEEITKLVDGIYKVKRFTDICNSIIIII